MITAKFGGTAVTPQNLRYIKQILTPCHKIVVVSAVGKEYKEDVKTTDLLRQYYENPQDYVWNAICDKYRRLVEVNGIAVDVEALLADAKQRATSYGVEYCMSLGEELSAKVVASFLNATYLEAEEIVRFNSGKCDYELTYRNVQNALTGVDLAVVGGFYGGENGNRQTFSRGGSDVTGAIFAAATNSTLYENWTDVYGVSVANPTKVHNVATVDSMSYNEMFLLSLAGAEVLHPDAVAPVEALSIPIKIGNFFNPNGASTLISSCPSSNKLLSIAEKVVDGKVVTTALHSYPRWQIMRLVSKFFQQNTAKIQFFDSEREFSSLKVYDLEFSDNMVRITTDLSILVQLYKTLIEGEQSAYFSS
ncbi:MAG: hypothetical protein J1F65_01485 [Clostridiales bacterium]|nr:hypothetical protein [Clostridiales bacterium]